MSRSLARVVMAFAAAFFAVFLLWPVVQILKGGFVDADGRLTFAFLGELLRNRLYLGGLENSFLLASSTTVLALLIAVPLALIAHCYRFPAKILLTSLILVPMVLPPFVGAIGIKQIFGQYGAFNALIIATGVRPAGWTFDWFAVSPFWGVAIVEALGLYPLVYLNAVAALASVDPTMEEAAASLGCTRLRRFWRITLPLIKPGLFAGSTIVFIWTFTELGVPIIFDYNQVTPVQIYHGLHDFGANPFPYVLAFIMLASCLGLYAVGKGVFGRKSYAMMTRATVGSGPRSPSPLPAWACTALFSGVTLVAVLPHLGVVLVAFAKTWHGTVLPSRFTADNFRLALGSDLTVPAIANSLKYSCLSTCIDVVLGIAIAHVIVRTRIAGRALLDFLVMLPLAVPGLVLAFGYLSMTQNGRVFSFLNPIANPTFLLVIAYSVRRLPYMVRSAAAGFQQTSETLEEAAANLGCPPLKTTIRITLPLIMANLIAGGLLAFAFAMLEVSDSLVLAQKRAFYPITKAIFELFQLLGDGRFLASALGAWAMVFLGVVILAAAALLGRKLSAAFRV